jgi:2-iminoacetate synthase
MIDIKQNLAQKQLDHHCDKLVGWACSPPVTCDKWPDALRSVTADDVQTELAAAPGHYSLKRLLVLVSAAAEDFLEEMAQFAHHLTVQRFGRTIQLYAPLYLSNFCRGTCLYCGYKAANEFERTRLTIDEAVADADILASEGFRHILLVSGNDPEYITIDYLAALVEKLKAKFSSISVEIYAMSRVDYRKLFKAGIDGVTLYQETYDRKTYAHYHPAGPKSDYDYRLETPDRFASAGMRRLGIGVLLGLSDWRLECLALAEHADYLMKHYWQSQVSFSFARLRPALNVGGEFEHLTSDRDLVQMMLALRLCFADAGIVLSTRERADLRDRLVKLCVTRMSAGSKTNPGGYSGKLDSSEQFQIDDTRTPAEVAGMIKSAGFEAVWKDWDTAFSTK